MAPNLHDRLSRLRWAIKQLVPCTYWTTYGLGINDEHGMRDEWRFVIWKMWLGRCYQTVEFPVAAGVSASNHPANVRQGDARSSDPWPTR